jgi:hypothetical protein
MASFYLFFSAIRNAPLMWARGLHGYTIDPIWTKLERTKCLSTTPTWSVQTDTSHTLQLWWLLETFLDCVQWPFQFHLDLGCPTGGTRALRSTQPFHSHRNIGFSDFVHRQNPIVTTFHSPKQTLMLSPSLSIQKGAESCHPKLEKYGLGMTPRSCEI